MADVEGNKDLALVLAMLSTVEKIDPDWHQVAAKVGIAHARTVY